jgi:hypothetical protein
MFSMCPAKPQSPCPPPTIDIPALCTAGTVFQDLPFAGVLVYGQMYLTLCDVTLSKCDYGVFCDVLGRPERDGIEGMLERCAAQVSESQRETPQRDLHKTPSHEPCMPLVTMLTPAVCRMDGTTIRVGGLRD